MSTVETLAPDPGALKPSSDPRNSGPVSSARSISWDSSLDRIACAGSRARVVPITTVSRMPRVTVVVPCFNYGHFLPACVGSLLEQADVEVDVVVVDDCSTDGSDQVADELAAADPRVRVIHHAQNAGHIATYNDGLAEVEGEYVVVLSADDLLTPGALGRATALLETHPNLGLVYGHAVRFATAAPVDPRTRPTSWMVWSGDDWLTERFRFGRNCILSPEVVMRTRVQQEIGGFRPDLPHSGDLELWLRAASVADIGFVGGVDQAWYREHTNNMHSTVFRTDELDGLTVDFYERLRAFEVAAQDLGPRVPEAGRLLMASRRALAVESLTLALRSCYWGVAHYWPIDELKAAAVEIYPSARRLPQWSALRVHRHLASGWRRRNPLTIGHEVSLMARDATREWRWARAGR